METIGNVKLRKLGWVECKREGVELLGTDLEVIYIYTIVDTREGIDEIKTYCTFLAPFNFSFILLLSNAEISSGALSKLIISLSKVIYFSPLNAVETFTTSIFSSKYLAGIKFPVPRVQYRTALFALYSSQV